MMPPHDVVVGTMFILAVACGLFVLLGALEPILRALFGDSDE